MPEGMQIKENHSSAPTGFELLTPVTGRLQVPGTLVLFM